MKHYVIFTQKELDQMKNGEIVSFPLYTDSQTFFMSDDTYNFITTPGVIEETNNKEEE